MLLYPNSKLNLIDIALLRKEVYNLEVIGLVQHTLYSSWFTNTYRLLSCVHLFSLLQQQGFWFGFVEFVDVSSMNSAIQVCAPWNIIASFFIDFRMCLLPRLVSKWYVALLVHTRRCMMNPWSPYRLNVHGQWHARLRNFFERQ